jgi:hypothetical protein
MFQPQDLFHARADKIPTLMQILIAFICTSQESRSTYTGHIYFYFDICIRVFINISSANFRAHHLTKAISNQINLHLY